MRNKKKRKDEKGKTKQAEVEKTLYQHISNLSYIPHISYIYFPYQRNKKFHIKTSLFEQFFFYYISNSLSSFCLCWENAYIRVYIKVHIKRKKKLFLVYLYMENNSTMTSWQHVDIFEKRRYNRFELLFLRVLRPFEQ